jgi:hypothetical protein
MLSARLVDDDVRDARELGIAVQPPQQHARRHEDLDVRATHPHECASAVQRCARRGDR